MLQIGDRVKLLSLEDLPSDLRYWKQQEVGVGLVTDVGSDQGITTWVYVRWENGSSNGYYQHALVLISSEKGVKEMKKRKREVWDSCQECKHYKHPAWATGIPGYLICVHPNADGIGRVDIQRNSTRTGYCGPSGAWWEPIPPEVKDDTVQTVPA
jgi:hypothetical protein